MVNDLLALSAIAVALAFTFSLPTLPLPIAMKFQRTPLMLVLIALGLGGVVYCSEFKQSPAPTPIQATAKPIFDFKEQDVRGVKIQSTRHTLAFEKGTQPISASRPAAKDPKAPKDQVGQEAKAAKDVKKSTPAALPSSFWQMTEPEKVPASDGQVAFLLNLLATGKSDRSFTVPIARLAEFGLDQPTATITVQLSNQQTHQLLIGLPNFDRKSVYAQIDPPATTPPATTNQEMTVWLVPFDVYQAIDRPLSDWKLVPDRPLPAATPSPASPEGEAPSSEALPSVSPPLAPAPTAPSPSSSTPANPAETP